MKLWAISDLHLGHADNRRALLELPEHPEDWLIVAGDVGETADHLHFALRVLVPRFRQVIWVPGNHDLWTLESEEHPLLGEAKYRQLVEICRSYGVLTPEDPYPKWPAADEGSGYRVAPLFLLYDYSFRPPHVPQAEAVEWAMETGILCSDEHLLHPTPYASRSDWCRARLRVTVPRLEEAASAGERLILVNHFPLRQDLAVLPRIPRFSIWCGTTATDDWHRRFDAAAVIFGHLHIKGTHFRDAVRFEEVSLGYPRDWNRELGVDAYLRQILPVPDTWLAQR